MDSEAYKIEILHYLNPHLIWIERQYGLEIILEQIGIFGLLPLTDIIDVENCKVSKKKAEEWVQAVIIVMKDFFKDNNDVYFEAIHIDRRSSIFNDNIHKFGEVFKLQDDGTKICLSTYIIDLGFGYLNETEFFQKLSTGNIKTKLNIPETNKVIMAIENYMNTHDSSTKRNKAVEVNTSMFRAIKHMGQTLTAKNLELHNRNQNFDRMGHVSKIIEQKTRDLLLCKVENDYSFGRGTTRLKSTCSDVSHSEASATSSKNDSPNSSKLTQANIKHTQNMSPDSTMTSPVTETKSKPEILELKQQDVELKKRLFSRRSGFENSSHVDVKDKDSKVERSKEQINTEAKEIFNYPSKDKQPVIKKGNNNLRSTKPYYIAFGPPMIDINTYKISSKYELEDCLAPSKPESQEKEDVIQVESNFDVKSTKIQKIDKVNDVVERNDTMDTFVKFDKDLVHKKDYRIPNHEKEKPKSNEVTIKSVETEKKPVNSFLQKKLKMLKDLTVTKTKVNTDSDEEINEIKRKLSSEYGLIDLSPKLDKIKTSHKVERNVNPFKNLDLSKSVFVDKLVSPILMVHTKNDSLVLPKSNLRDIPFKSNTFKALKNLQVKEPSRLQSVSWPYILKGHSVFMVSPAGSGKTIGYIPAVCNLVTDNVIEIESVGPICIIVCATARSVGDITYLCKLFLGLEDRVLSCFHGINLTTLTTSLLNGCDILVCTPPMLYKLLMTDLGVDLRRLATLVFDDCERLTLVYESELKTIQYYVKEMLKNRSNKKLKVQYIMASRTWCEFMKPLSKKIPDTIVAIAAFQECVLYSKCKTSVEFVLQENKLKSVLEFFDTIDKSKRTVIVCRADDEVLALEDALSKNNTIFACNSTMTLLDLYNLNVAWSNYQETLRGPVLICCDGNLTHLNVVDANYLVHYSMPEFFSMFCKRFSVLNENYSSVFSEKKNDVKIKILIEENNVEQLPKILNFIKRCTSEVPEVLEEMSRKVLEQKDLVKAEKFVPLCDTMMAFSKCSDNWHCQERHAILKAFDEPKDWIPRDGIITFNILYYHTAVTYSASLLSHITSTDTIKYPRTYSTLSLKMGMYYSKESNRRSHGTPKIGDICAVALKYNLYSRCQVVKILSYYKENPQDILVRMIDEEQLETVRDIHLYHLPAELKNIETHTVKIRLANIEPQDKDVTFSDLARDQLKKITDTDENLYMRGQVVLAVGNTIFVDTLEACQDLTTLNQTVVKYDFKDTLLESHAKLNPDHIVKLKEMCKIGGLEILSEKIPKIINRKVQRNYRWAHLPDDEIPSVIFSYGVNPSKFFVKLSKFQKCCDLLLSDIKKYVAENPKPLESYKVGDIVLAEIPLDNSYERARIEAVLDNNEVTCFFVDSGDLFEVSTEKLIYIPRNFIEQLPFQVIECRLIGVEPFAENWTEFSKNWLCDMCFEDSDGKTKQLYVKHFTKEKAEMTGGNKYGVLIFDTNTDKDIIINKMMVELKLAREKADEVEYLNYTLETEKEVANVSDNNDTDWEIPKITNHKSVIPFDKQENSITGQEMPPIRSLFQPIRSVPLVDDNISLSDCDINIDEDLTKAFGLNQIIKPQMFNTSDESNKDTSEDESVALNKMQIKVSVNQMFASKKKKSQSRNSINENEIDSKIETKTKELNNNACVKINKNKIKDKEKITKETNINEKSNGEDEKVSETDKKLSNMNKNISETDKKRMTIDKMDEKISNKVEKDEVDGNTIPKSKEPEKTVKTTTTVASELETAQETKRKGSAEDPNIVMDDIQELSAIKPNIFKLFAKTSPVLLERRINAEIDNHNDTKSNVVATEKQNDTKSDTISVGNTSKTSKSDFDSDDLSTANPIRPGLLERRINAQTDRHRDTKSYVFATEKKNDAKDTICVRNTSKTSKSDLDSDDLSSANLIRETLINNGTKSNAVSIEKQNDTKSDTSSLGNTSKTSKSDLDSDDLSSANLIRETLINNGTKSNAVSIEKQNDTKSDTTSSGNTSKTSKSDLDSDDLSSANLIREKLINNGTKSNAVSIEKQNDTRSDTTSLGNTSKTSKSDLDSDDLSSANVSVESGHKVIYGAEEETSRKPKLVWRQNKNYVTIKIQLIGVETYALEIHERSLIFFCYHNDIPYEFHIELYGIITTKKSSHANKGQYIQVNLEKMLKTNWMNLTKDNKSKIWVVYDKDSIDKAVSSDEEVAPNSDILKIIKEDYEKAQLDSDDDDDFMDDQQLEQFRYKKY